MKEFTEFEKYFEEHIKEAAYDSIDALRARNDPPNLSAEDMTFVVLAAREGALSVLRQYHTWLKRTLL